MPQISPISWGVILTLLTILMTSTSLQINHSPTKPLPTCPIKTSSKPTKW